MKNGLVSIFTALILFGCVMPKQKEEEKPLTPKDLCQHHPNVKMNEYFDQQSAGWAYKKDDRAYVASIPGCKTKWNLITWKNHSNLHLEIRDECTLSPSAARAVYDVALCNVVFDYPAGQIKSVTVTGMYGRNLWRQRMMEASKKSARWKAFLESRKKSRHLLSNAIFVEIFNQNEAHSEMKDLFKDYGLVINLKNVEKVSEEKQLLTGAGIYHFETNLEGSQEL